MDRYVFLTWIGTLFACSTRCGNWRRCPRSSSNPTPRPSGCSSYRTRWKNRTCPTPLRLPPARRNHRIPRPCPSAIPAPSTDAVKNVSLTIRAGQTVAIVGPTDRKTTLVSMVPRLLDPTGGAILIDGQEHYACVLPLIAAADRPGDAGQACCSTRTIGENISYGLRRPRQEDVLAASRKAFVDEFVHDLPDGYDTMVGEHGTTLSAGRSSGFPSRGRFCGTRRS